MRAVLFILKLGLKILAVPVVLALTLFTWLCFWLLYVSSFIFGLVSTVVAGPADGRRLAGGQGTGPAVCDPGRGVWLNRKRRIAGSECPAIF